MNGSADDGPPRDARRDSIARMIANSADAAPDLVFDVEHGDCGDRDCTRGPGTVSIVVTWLDPAVNDGVRYRADIDDRGHPVCGQVVRRASVRLRQLALTQRQP